MKGISEINQKIQFDRNTEIYKRYKEEDVTMDGLAVVYELTKQRVWQIVRRCQIGNGNYYEGYTRYKSKEESLKELGVKGNKLHELMRKWMKEQGAKVIKLRNEGK
tara:strand:+ start:268 stop:585 length:318 start_codon:yes stop_codon:yes gene_type:complete